MRCFNNPPMFYRNVYREILPLSFMSFFEGKLLPFAMLFNFNGDGQSMTISIDWRNGSYYIPIIMDKDDLRSMFNQLLMKYR